MKQHKIPLALYVESHTKKNEMQDRCEHIVCMQQNNTEPQGNYTSMNQASHHIQ